MNKLNIHEYNIWIKELKNKIYEAQIKAGQAVSSTLLKLYWEVGINIYAIRQWYLLYSQEYEFVLRCVAI